MTLDEATVRVSAIAKAALEVRDDVIVLCHGGPVSTPEDAAVILSRCPQCHGFYGASSMERLPTEIALVEQTRRFKEIKRNEGQP
jgi:predicted TIM-barrel enzyme